MMNKISFRFLAAAFVIFSVASADAYIPHSRTIVSRVVRQHGKGAYAIEQEVIFRTTTEPVTLRERWIVENGETFRLSVYAPKGSTYQARFDALYKNGKKTAPDFNGSLKTSAVSSEFLESFHHARSSSGLLASLIRSRIVPASFGKSRPPIKDLKNLKHTPEPLVRLGRGAGAIAWVFGEPTPTDAKRLNPAIWIEQDAFLVRRLRFPSEAEMSASKHSTFPRDLVFPRERTVSWENNSATIRIVSVKVLSASQSNKLLSPNSIKISDAQAARLPDQMQVKEFYSRFR